jgi:hypothetical protein
MPVVPSYGGDEEYSLQRRQLTYQPTRGPPLPRAAFVRSGATCSATRWARAPLGTGSVGA